MKRDLRSLTGAALLGFAAVAAGCSTTTPAASDTLRNPRSLALVCETSAGPRPIGECTAGTGVRAYVSGGSIGSIAIANPAASTWVDTDPSVPGYTPKMVGDLPQALIADPLDGSVLYFGLGLQPRLGRLRLPALSIDWLDMSFVPGVLVATTNKDGTLLWVADPTGAAVWTVPAKAFDGGAQPTRFDVGGSPWAIAVSSLDGRAYVGHLAHDHITVVGADGAIEQQIGLGPQCGDGIDNDGDGKTDRDDAGCDDLLDAFEGDPELGALCNDNLDNDGDGHIDALDPGCAATPTVDACRNGVDDDGDGKTDFPDDPGCIGFGGTSEAMDAPSCGDGIDNDGDGSTDFPVDSDCSSAAADSERTATAASAIGPCNDGVDNDGDGKTDFPDDSDCSGALAGGELRPPCADGVDNDGDGKTDLDDEACIHRGSPAEVADDRDPVPTLSLTADGSLLFIGHRARSALQVLDTKTMKLLAPAHGSETPFLRPSRLDARDGLTGLSLPNPPLAMAAIEMDGRPALAMTLSLTGLVLTQIYAAPAEGSSETVGERTIALREQSETPATTASKPSLTVGNVSIDLGGVAPSRYANPGPLDTDNDLRYFGLFPSEEIQDHRTELWRLVYQGRVPGSARSTGHLVAPTLLVDPAADFCRMGVVAGDFLLLQRDVDALECEGMPAGTTRWRVVKVGVDRLWLDGTSGAVDAAITSANQLDPPTATPVASLAPACFVAGGANYEVRADGWLVVGSRSGLLSSRGRDDGLCAAWSNADPLMASRIVEPTLKADQAPTNCPLLAEDLAERMEQLPYGGGAPGPTTPFANAVFNLQMQPGCVASDIPGESTRLLPSMRDATWRYAVFAGIQPRVINVGAAAVAIAAAPKLGILYVVEQGSGVLEVIDIARAVVTAVLE